MRGKNTHIASFIFSRLRLAALVVSLCFFAIPAHVAARMPQIPAEYKLKAAFLYNFTRFVEWPNYTFANATSPIIIGIVGTDPYGTFLDELVAGERIGNRAIIVRRYADIKDISDCHILYINYSETEKISSCLSIVSNKGVLTINDVASFTRMGGMVQFYTEKNKIRMQINNGAAKRAGLNISTKVLSVSKVVN